jgi:hypothetical protein
MINAISPITQIFGLHFKLFYDNVEKYLINPNYYFKNLIKILLYTK